MKPTILASLITCCLALSACAQTAGNDTVDNTSLGTTVFTDAGTGCRYFVSYDNRFTPRLRRDGTVDCPNTPPAVQPAEGAY